MIPRYDAHGILSFWFVVPSIHMANLLERRLLEEFPQLNYCCRWKDVKGAGISLTVVPWKTSGVYRVPN